MALVIVILRGTVFFGFSYLQNEISALQNQNPAQGTLFTVTGKQQTTKSVNGQYDVTHWNFPLHSDNNILQGGSEAYEFNIIDEK